MKPTTRRKALEEIYTVHFFLINSAQTSTALKLGMFKDLMKCCWCKKCVNKFNRRYWVKRKENILLENESLVNCRNASVFRRNLLQILTKYSYILMKYCRNFTNIKFRRIYHFHCYIAYHPGPNGIIQDYPGPIPASPDARGQSAKQ